MKTHFSCIAILGRVGKASVQRTVNDLAKLLNSYHYDVVVNDETSTLMDDSTVFAVEILDNDTLVQRADLVIVVGGDGSILQACDIIKGADTPILGINRGRLGFLADVSPSELASKVLAVLGGAFELDERFLLHTQIKDDTGVVYNDVALNDVVLHAGKSVHTLDFELAIDGIDVYRQHADGLIVSTPTGSTAYNLSAGGPIIHPRLSAICLVPMHPHTLSSRPILIADTSHIVIKVHKDNRTQPMISCDGKTSVPLNVGQTLHITKYPHVLTLLHPVGYDFYEACRTKLNWSLYSEEFMLSQQDE